MDELDFYDKGGKAVAYSQDGVNVYTFSGRPVAYFEKEYLYSFSGVCLGWYQNGWVRDREGECILFTQNSQGGPVKPMTTVTPLKAIKDLRPIKELPSLSPRKPISSRPGQNSRLLIFSENKKSIRQGSVKEY
ncbi:hypothetical protein JWG44_02325 [Leptospira sp. 201903071]|uniref:4-fold beta flower protein n=1 Tax=Leptospira ainazelensis TaxID=2810034 RepID=UPI001963F2D3|nr:hypothetical protein [Leptospira ainazelensis]MBM9499089.1 hypothetical protein [Leptospira ainazelensis]